MILNNLTSQQEEIDKLFDYVRLYNLRSINHERIFLQVASGSNELLIWDPVADHGGESFWGPDLKFLTLY